MTSLVTGATGFVGSHVVDALLARGETVRALVRDEARAGALKRRGVEVLVGDLCDRATLDRAVQGMDVVYHCGAVVGAEHSKEAIYRVNRDGVRLLLESVRQAGKGKVILLSSINVLGTCDLERAAEDLPCKRSNDPAADVKIEAEQLALDAQRNQHVDVVILRPGFIYGPRDTRNLPTLAGAVRTGKFRYFGDRHHVVPIVHVSDVVQALLLAAQTSKASARIYHITDGSRTTIEELVSQLAELQGCPAPQRVLPLAVARFLCWLGVWMGRLKLRRNRPPVISPAALRFLGTSRWVDIGRAREELGYEPRVSCREGVAGTLRWIQEQSRGQAIPAQSST